jgi:adenylate cyclase
MSSAHESPKSDNFLARLGVEFADREMEACFAADYLSGSLRITQSFLILGAFGYYIFFICDRIMDPVGGELGHIIRGFIAAPVFTVAALLLSTRLGRRYHELLAVLAYMVGQIGLVVIYGSINHGYDFAAMAFVLLLMGTNAAFSLRTKYLILIAIFALTTTVIGHVIADNARPRWIIINILAVLTGILFSSISAYLRERAARRQFMTDKALLASRARVDDLLTSMLPAYIVQRIQAGETGIADSLGEVSVIFANVGNVADTSQGIAETQLLRGLNQLFSDFDREAERYGIDKIKTVGGSYMAIGGLAAQGGGEDHVKNAADFALAIQAIVAKIIEETGYPVNLRVGVHVGPVVAGVIGVQRPVFDCWGESVNLASRLENSAPLREILISESTYWRLKSQFDVDFHQEMTLKGIGRTKTYCLKARSSGQRQSDINNDGLARVEIIARG